MTRKAKIRRFRAGLAIFIAGLVLSGLAAFPLLHETRWLCATFGIPSGASPQAYAGLRFWLATVSQGLERTDAVYPWISYGTDWLAFAHVAISVFFIGPWLDPVKNRWVLLAGLACCALVVPLALVAGAVRGIPFYWRLLDCSFGVLGAIPLFYCWRLSGELDAQRPP
jgi:hypothetical protein